MDQAHIDAHNRGAEFLAQTNDDDGPCIKLPDGRLIYGYYDPDGALVASVDTEDGDGEPLTVRFVHNGVVVHEVLADLPIWDEMSDRDKGAALLHVWKRDWEGEDEAVENYPARYLDDPHLTGLSPETASQHAADVTDGYDAIRERIGSEEFQRLYELGLAADRARDGGQGHAAKVGKITVR